MERGGGEEWLERGGVGGSKGEERGERTRVGERRRGSNIGASGRGQGERAGGVLSRRPHLFGHTP